MLASNVIRIQKEDMRRRIIALRSSLQPDLHSRYSQAICDRAEQLLATFPFSPDSLVLVYMPFGREIDILPLIERFWQRGISVAAPVSRSAPKRLEWRRTSGLSDLEPGVWGIREPSQLCPLVEDFSKAELLLLPGVAFDSGCGRLGYGGGYYDRFLGDLPASSAPFKLALAFDLQIVERVPFGKYDQYADAVLTESCFFSEKDLQAPWIDQAGL